MKATHGREGVDDDAVGVQVGSYSYLVWGGTDHPDLAEEGDEERRAPSLSTRDDREDMIQGANRGRPGDLEQFVEQLDGVIEAEASRADAAGDGALQLQASVACGAHSEGHADGDGASASGSMSRLDRWGRRRSACCGVEWARVGIGMVPAVAARRFMRWLVGEAGSRASGAAWRWPPDAT